MREVRASLRLPLTAVAAGIILACICRSTPSCPVAPCDAATPSLHAHSSPSIPTKWRRCCHSASLPFPPFVLTVSRRAACMTGSGMSLRAQPDCRTARDAMKRTATRSSRTAVRRPSLPLYPLDCGHARCARLRGFVMLSIRASGIPSAVAAPHRGGAARTGNLTLWKGNLLSASPPT